MEKIRVLHVLYGMNQGGVENLIMNMYRKIDKDKIQFDFATVYQDEAFFDKEILENGGRIFKIVDFKNNIINPIKYFFNLIDVLKRNPEIKVIHSHVHYFSGIVLLAARLCGVKIRIAHSHNTESIHTNKGKRKIYIYIMGKLIKANATNMIACSENSAMALFGENYKSNKKVSVVYNGIDLNKFNFNRLNTKHVNKKTLNFVHVGRLSKEKNHKFLIKVFNEIIKVNSNVHLTIVGGGNELDSIKKQVKDMNIQKYITFTGVTSEIVPILNDMDYCIFPSIQEAFPVSLIEMQAMNIKCFISSHITDEVDLGLCYFIDLDKNEKEWSKQILENLEKNNVKLDLEKCNINKTIQEIVSTYCS